MLRYVFGEDTGGEGRKQKETGKYEDFSFLLFIFIIVVVIRGCE